MFQKIGLIISVSMLGLLWQSGLTHAEETAPTEDVFAAPQVRGQILKTSGVVKIVNAQGEEREASGAEIAIHENDTVKTSAGGQAVVQTNDGSLSILSEKSVLKVEKKGWLSHLGGKIYFTFRKVFSGSQQVKAKFSTIGVRGTTFVVTDTEEEGSGVALQEGELEFVSSGYGYQVHRKRDPDDFETFKQRMLDGKKDMQKEYEKYKQATMEGFFEYKKKFTLTPNYRVVFNGSIVKEIEMTDKDKEVFSDFESVAGEMLEEFRRQSKEHREKHENEQEQGS
ncbi:MAG: FecR family protein [Gammaproteobacteria bacterium]|nr:FecR family protein [Gammaproteobacteria bacterium]MCW8924212.1 FecR family protein [Gammaproteobacteria bacterium]